MVHIKAAGRVQITYTPEAMVQLTCTLVHPKLSIMCSQFENDTTVAQQPSCTLGYVDVSWLQRHRLVYMGFVHCGPFKCLHTMVQLGISRDVLEYSWDYLDLG